jgi:hypothetical protein
MFILLAVAAEKLAVTHIRAVPVAAAVELAVLAVLGPLLKVEMGVMVEPMQPVVAVALVQTA